MQQKFIIDGTIYQHLMFCALITFIGGLIMYFLSVAMFPAIVSGSMTALACGVTKEYVDGIRYYWNWGDMLGNGIGVVIGIVLLILLYVIF